MTIQEWQKKMASAVDDLAYHAKHAGVAQGSVDLLIEAAADLCEETLLEGSDE